MPAGVGGPVELVPVAGDSARLGAAVRIVAVADFVGLLLCGTLLLLFLLRLLFLAVLLGLFLLLAVLLFSFLLLLTLLVRALLLLMVLLCLLLCALFLLFLFLLFSADPAVPGAVVPVHAVAADSAAGVVFSTLLLVLLFFSRSC